MLESLQHQGPVTQTQTQCRPRESLKHQYHQTEIPPLHTISSVTDLAVSVHVIPSVFTSVAFLFFFVGLSCSTSSSSSLALFLAGVLRLRDPPELALPEALGLAGVTGTLLSSPSTVAPRSRSFLRVVLRQTCTELPDAEPVSRATRFQFGYHWEQVSCLRV